MSILNDPVRTLLGFGFSIFFGQWVIKWLNYKSRAYLAHHNPGLKSQLLNGQAYRQTRLLAFVETIMYVGTIAMEKPEFIAIWLAFKVALSWEGWENEKNLKRVATNHYVIFNAISIINGYFGACIVKGELLYY